MTRFRSLRLMLNLVPVMLRLRHAKPSDLNTIRALVRAQFPEVTQASIPTLAAWIDQPNAFPPLLVDVRSQSEFQVSHLRNAVNTASVQEIKGLAAASDPARPIV